MAKLTDEDWEAKAFEAGQLYSPAAPIDERDLFAGRSEQVGKMLEAVNERGKDATLCDYAGDRRTTYSAFVFVGAFDSRRA